MWSFVRVEGVSIEVGTRDKTKIQWANLLLNSVETIYKNIAQMLPQNVLFFAMSIALSIYFDKWNKPAPLLEILPNLEEENNSNFTKYTDLGKTADNNE